MHITPGEKVVIIGPSGSGKSTLLRCLNMLETPSTGEINYHGTDITSKNVNVPEYRSKVGMVFQNFNLFPHYTVMKNIIDAPIHVDKVSRTEAVARAEKLLAQLGLSDKADAYPYQLSGGQQQRVAIVRAVVTECKLLLADEPTGNLDSVNGIEVMELLSELNRQGTTIIIVTHSQRDAKYAHRVIQLLDGQIVAENINRPLEKKTSSKNETV